MSFSKVEYRPLHRQLLVLAVVTALAIAATMAACGNVQEGPTPLFQVGNATVVDADSPKALAAVPASANIIVADDSRQYKRYSNWGGAEWPDLSVSTSRNAWAKLVNEQAKERLVLQDVSYPYLSRQIANSDRKMVLNKIAELFLGLAQIRIDEQLLRIVFPIVAQELSIEKRDRAVAADAPSELLYKTAIGKTIDPLVLPPDGAKWASSSPRYDKSGGFYHYDFRLEYQGVMVLGVTLTITTHVDFDSDSEQLYAIDLRKGKALEQDFHSLAVAATEYQEANNLCTEAYKSSGSKVEEEKIWSKEFTYILCGEAGCGTQEEWQTSTEGELPYRCYISVEDKTVTSFGRMEVQNARATSTTYIPYLSWQNGMAYGELQIIQATSSACNSSSTPVRNGSTAVWTDFDGNFSVSGQYTCLIPDAHAMSNADDLLDKSGFMYCSPNAHVDYTACDETNSNENRDAEIWSPPVYSTSPSWTISDDLTRKRWSVFYHFNWIRDVFSNIGLPTQCKRSGINKFTKWRTLYTDSGGQTTPDRCSIYIGTSGDYQFVNTTYHEYEHMLRINARSGGVGDEEGEAGYSGQKCFLKENDGGSPFWQDEDGHYQQSWYERNMHAVSYAASAFANYVRDDVGITWSYNLDFNYYLPVSGYPFPSVGGVTNSGPTYQLARTFVDLTWMTSLTSFAKYVSTSTGLRMAGNPRFDGKCTGPYISGYSVKDTRVYCDENGTDTTSACACYRGSCGGTTCNPPPSHRSERQDVAVALGIAGEPWYTYEADRTFNQWSQEGGAASQRWDDDVTNLWYGGPLITRPAVDFPTNSAFCIRRAPDVTTRSLSLYDASALPDREYDYDDFSFQPGYAKSYSFWVYNQTASTQLWLRVHDKDRSILNQINVTTCPGGQTGDACKTDASPFYDANTTHIRIGEVSGIAATYAMKVLLKNDDHNDFAPEATALPVSSSTTQVGTIDNANDEDWFRVFVPDNSTYALSNLDVRACSESGSQLEVTLFNSYRNGSGRYVANVALYNQDTNPPNYSPKTFTTACPTGSNRALTVTQRQWRYSPGVGNTVSQGWYMIRVRGVSGSTGRYYISAGDDPSTSMSGPCSGSLIPLISWADNMYQNVDATNPNRIFRGAGVLKNKNNPDWYELDLTSSSMQGRYVSVDVIGLNGYATDANYLDPMVELHWNTNDGANTYYNGGACSSGTSSLPIISDTDGGLQICEDSTRCQLDTNCRPDTSAHMAFRVNRPVKLRLRVGSTVDRTNFRPYQIWVDIKKQSTDTTEPSVPAWN